MLRLAQLSNDGGETKLEEKKIPRSLGYLQSHEGVLKQLDLSHPQPRVGKTPCYCSKEMVVSRLRVAITLCSGSGRCPQYPTTRPFDEGISC